MKKILFVCIENSNRSQMAESFAKIHGQGIVEAYSAGSKPSGNINPKAVEAMKEIGYDLTTHQSKSLDKIPQAEYEYVVSMGCGDLPATHISSSRQAGLPATLIPLETGWYVYILKCKDGSLYKGSTNDLIQRLREHEAGKVSGTSKRLPVSLVYYERFDAEGAARKREQDLKTGFGRKWLKDYLASRQAGLPAPHISSSRQAGNCPFISAKNRIEWNIPDPKNMDKDQLREVRRLIEQQVKELIEKIKTFK